jgi:hypothetical protein
MLSSIKLISIVSVVVLFVAPLASAEDSKPREPPKIDWVTAKKAFAEDQKREGQEISKVRASAVDLGNVNLPVLALSAGGPSRGNLSFAELGTSYVINYPYNGANLAIMGSATPLPLDDKSQTGQQFEDAAKQPDSSGFEQSEDGADFNLTKFGASYVLRLTCDELDDERCKKPDFLVGIAKQLIVTGGAQLK